MSFRDIIQKELKCSWTNFYCTHEEPRLFGVSQWPWCPDVFFILLHRLPWAAFFLVNYLCHLYKKETTEPGIINYHVFFSAWSELLVAVTGIYALIVAILIWRGCLKEWRPFLSIYWVTYNICIWTSPIVVITYWSLVFQGGGSPGFHAIAGHTLNGFYVILETCVSATPLRIHHAYHGIIFGLSYIFFNCCYYLAGGTNPYDGSATTYDYLNWDKDPWLALLKGLAVVVLATMIWVLMFGIYVLRIYIHSKIYKKSDEEWTEIP